MDKRITRRRALERDLTHEIVQALIFDGYRLSLKHDGEPAIELLNDSRSVEEILACDETVVCCRKDGARRSVLFVFGNDGWDAAADYSVALAPIIDPIVDRFCRMYEDGDGCECNDPDAEVNCCSGDDFDRDDASYGS